MREDIVENSKNFNLKLYLFRYLNERIRLDDVTFRDFILIHDVMTQAVQSKVIMIDDNDYYIHDHCYYHKYLFFNDNDLNYAMIIIIIAVTIMIHLFINVILILGVIVYGFRQFFVFLQIFYCGCNLDK